MTRKHYVIELTARLHTPSGGLLSAGWAWDGWARLRLWPALRNDRTLGGGTYFGLSWLGFWIGGHS
jgi:hypothetical protein